jgi:hypothetical protein
LEIKVQREERGREKKTLIEAHGGALSREGDLILDRIKGLAAKEKRTGSAILREVLGKYLKNK